MARIFNRGQHIVFKHSFYDSSGDITSPTTANLIVSYPSDGFPFRSFAETTTIPMVQSTEGSTHADYLTWSATWASGAGYPGPVHWSIRASDLSLAVADGEITVRGNPANLSVTTTT
jgi:hypothetical protein